MFKKIIILVSVLFVISTSLFANVLLMIKGKKMDSIHSTFLGQIRQAFKKNGVDVLDLDVVDELNKIFKRNAIDSDIQLNNAIDEYFNLNMDHAQEMLGKIINKSCEIPLEIDNGETCFKALLYDALLSRTLSDNITTIKKIKRAINVAPNVSLSNYIYPESFIDLYERVKKENYLFVDVKIQSSPDRADIYINGLYAGQTPLDQKMPIGKYFVTLKYGEDRYLNQIDIKNKKINKYYLFKKEINKLKTETNLDYEFLTRLGVRNILFLNTESGFVDLEKIINNEAVRVDSFRLENIEYAMARIEKTLSEESVQYFVSNQNK